jgi:hypothetical protein
MKAARRSCSVGLTRLNDPMETETSDLGADFKSVSPQTKTRNWRIECQCVPWLEHEILHRSEPDWTLPEAEPTAYTTSVSCFSGFRFFPNAGSISPRPASVKRRRGRDGYWHRKRDRTQKQCRNVVRLSAVNSQRVAVQAGPQLYASSVNFHAHSGSHSQHQ